MTSATILEINDLTLGYGDSVIIDGLDVEIPKGKFTALVGPNGCGKSTLLKSLARTLSPTRGTITLKGKSIHKTSAKALAREIAFLPQVLTIPEGISVRELVGYGRSPYNDLWGRLKASDHRIVDEAIERVQIGALADRWLHDLSGGQRQRAWLAMILAQRAPLVLLDEPTTYLDINHQVELMDMIRDMVAQGQTVIAVLHDLNQAFRHADHVIMLKEGQLAISASPAEAATSELMQQVFSVEAEIHPDPLAGSPMVIVRQSPCERQLTSGV